MDTPASAQPPGRSLVVAVVTALGLLGLIIVCYLLGRTAFFVLVCAVVLLALYEMTDGLRGLGHRVNPYLALVCALGVLIAAYLRRPEVFAIAVAAATAGAFALALRPGRGAAPASDVAWTVLGVSWIGGGGAGAASILMLPGGRLLIIAMVAVVALDDIGAYFVGSSLGRHKMAPTISPAKSWEGFFGGLATALLTGAGVGVVLNTLSVIEGVGLGLVAAFFGPAGDLVESMFKREVGIKDSGRLLPGHGGMLDRIDAILFTAPAAYLYLLLVVG